MGEERLLTVAEVAALLQVDEQTVRRWIRDRKLAAHRIGGKAGYRIQRADLQAFLAATREPSGSEGKAAA
jgi:excisionase family DNA binding protein